MTPNNVLALCATTALVAFAGCEPQVDGGYEGEPFATLKGTVINERSAPLEGEIEVGILWYAKKDGDEIGIVTERGSVTGDFPASYTLHLHSPPPLQARNLANELFLTDGCIDDHCLPPLPADVQMRLEDEFGELSMGGLLLTKAGGFETIAEFFSDDPPEEEEGLDIVVGGARGIVFYVHRDFSAESYVGRAFGRALPEGFYLAAPNLEHDYGKVFDCRDEAGDDQVARLDCDLEDYAESMIVTDLEDVELVLVDDPEEILEYAFG